MNKAKYLVVFKLRDQISTIVEANDNAEAREEALKQLDHFVTNKASVSAVLKNNDISRDVELVRLPERMFY